MPRFSIQLCSTQGIIGQSFEEQPRSMREPLPRRDYAIIRSVLFRTSRSAHICDMLSSDLVVQLATDIGNDQESREVLFCTGSAIIFSIRQGEQWG